MKVPHVRLKIIHGDNNGDIELIFTPFAGWVGEQGEKSQLSFWEKKKPP